MAEKATMAKGAAMVWEAAMAVGATMMEMAEMVRNIVLATSMKRLTFSLVANIVV